MPVHSAGSRLYKSVPFKHLVRKSGSAAKGHSSNISLNLTPFVDMMTILVTFLLMVFSSSGELIHAQPHLDLPIADANKPLQNAPVIIVTKDTISFFSGNLQSGGGPQIKIEDVLREEGGGMKIDALLERLQASAKAIQQQVLDNNFKDKSLKAACEAAKEGKKSKDGTLCPEGVAILQADEGTDARVINKLVNTAKLAGFDNLLFAVKNKN